MENSTRAVSLLFETSGDRVADSALSKVTSVLPGRAGLVRLDTAGLPGTPRRDGGSGVVGDRIRLGRCVHRTSSSRWFTRSCRGERAGYPAARPGGRGEGRHRRCRHLFARLRYGAVRRRPHGRVASAGPGDAGVRAGRTSRGRTAAGPVLSPRGGVPGRSGAGCHRITGVAAEGHHPAAGIGEPHRCTPPVHPPVHPEVSGGGRPERGRDAPRCSGHGRSHRARACP